MSTQAIKIVEEEIARVRKEWEVDISPEGDSQIDAVCMVTDELLERIKDRIEKECVEICPGCSGEQGEHSDACDFGDDDQEEMTGGPKQWPTIMSSEHAAQESARCYECSLQTERCGKHREKD